MNTNRWKITALGIAAASVTLQGCLSVPVNIRTDPSGATVFANGQVVGTTPMEITADKYFPHRRKGLDWHREGTLRLERPGCDPKTLEVDNETLKRTLRVDLDCRPDAPVFVAPTATAAQPAVPAAASTGATAERLEEVEALRSQGLITAEEYRSIRARILDRL
jgi:hypothetical protein